MKYYIYTLGCKVNTYESAIMEEQLKLSGYVSVTKEEIADIYIINTCTVTNTAGNKSMKMIRQAIRKNPNAIIVVVGCLSQVESKIVSNIDGVSIILGNKNKSSIVDYIERFKTNKKQIIDIYNLEDTEFECMKLNNFNKTRAFIKIQDGCNNFCSYCIIPYTRGNVRSKKREDVLIEIKNLVEDGHKEIVLTGIHTGHYGSDLDNYKFADLLSEIVEIKGLERVRISSIEITEIDNDVLNVIRNSSVIVDHIHIPLQSGCDKTLKDMNRKYDMNYFKEKINELRKIRPDISITTDVIVGFPNETDEDFNVTCENIHDINFSKIHVFPYSVRKGTKAELMENHISEVIKNERVKNLLELSKELELNYMKKHINKNVTFIPEVFKNGNLIGHTGNYLLIKMVGNQDMINKDVKAKIIDIDYPYCLATLHND